MKFTMMMCTVLLFSCNSEKEPQKAAPFSIKGTWKLIGATTIQQGSTKTDDLTGKEMIKIINDSHFSFLNHDVNKGKDSTAYFMSGGGRYTLVGNQYTEYLDYCSAREWEANKFDFTVEIKGDTLVQTGIEKVEEAGVDRKIIETYLKVMN